MADRYIVATDRDGLLLEKIANIEAAHATILPLLAKIITLLEAQVTKPEPKVATYDDLYPPIEAGPPEGELVAACLDAQGSTRVGWWGRLFAVRTPDERP